MLVPKMVEINKGGVGGEFYRLVGWQTATAAEKNQTFTFIKSHSRKPSAWCVQWQTDNLAPPSSFILVTGAIPQNCYRRRSTC